MTGLFSKETRRAIRIQPGELRIVLWAAAYFFFVLAGMSILRPVREQFGVSAGLDKLPWLFVGTWLVMLLLNPVYGAVVSRLPRERFIPLVYRVFMLLLVGFFLLLTRVGEDGLLAAKRAFYVFYSVFNLWIVAVFWSFLADHFGSANAKRLYAWIAVGGTVGSIAGSMTTWAGLGLIGDDDLAARLIPYLLLVSALALEGAVWCTRVLLRLFPTLPDMAGPPPLARLGGASLDGLKEVLRSPYLLRICVYLFCYTVSGTLLYFMQAGVVHEGFATAADRTRAFALIDVATQVTTLVVQVFLTRRLIASLGLGRTLAVLPVVTALAFVSVAAWPVFWVLVVAQGLRRSARYAVSKPSREVLFAVLERSEKYKAKAVIDTFVYRSGDVVGGLVSLGARALAPGMILVTGIAVPLAGFWALVAIWLGRAHAVRVQGDERAKPGYSPPSASEGPGPRG